MRYLIALDGSPGSKNAFDFFLESVLREAKEDDHLLLLSVVEELSTLDFHEPLAITGDWVAKANEEMKENARKMLLAYVARCKETGIKYTAIIHVAAPRTAIISQAKNHEADMIVVGSRGMGALKQMLLGSVSQYLVTHSPIPVLVVHPKEH